MLDFVGDWLASVWDQVSRIEPRYILLACTLQAAQTVLVGISWRNILRASFPDSDVPTKPIVAAYAAGIGLNAVLPAQAGTVATLGLFRRAIPGSKLVTIGAGAVAQSVFFTAVGIGVYVYLLFAHPDVSDHTTSDLGRHVMFWLAIGVVVVVIVALIARHFWGRVRRFWTQARAGAAILGEPMRFLREVVAIQAASYILRLGVNATFMYAVGIPVTLETVLLIAAANSLASTLAVTPGGLGTQQALAAIVLRSVAPAALVAACSLAQEAVLMVFNLVFGVVLLGVFFGLDEIRTVFASSREVQVERA